MGNVDRGGGHPGRCGHDHMYSFLGLAPHVSPLPRSASLGLQGTRPGLL